MPFAGFLVGMAAAGVLHKPSIVHIVADDLGFNDVWRLDAGSGEIANNPHTYTPHITQLLQHSIALTAYHTYKVCSPSRASIMTGRYPWGLGYYDMKGQEAIPLAYKLVSELLADAGYETHALGKWNLGSKVKPYTPTRRGFSTFFGYYAAAQVDYWYHGAGPQECGIKGTGGNSGKPLAVGNITDFSNSTENHIAGAHGLNGTYNEELFTQEAVRLIHGHADALRGGQLRAGTPLYMYLAYHNVHGAVNDDAPQQAPRAVVEMYNTTKLDTYKVQGAMVSKLDDGVGAVFAALDSSGLLQNGVIAFCSDNGSCASHTLVLIQPAFTRGCV